MSNVSELLTLPWVISEIFAVLIVTNGFFLSKYLSRFDSFAKAVISLDKTIAILNEKLASLQTNDHEKSKIIAQLAKKIARLTNAFLKLKISVQYCQSKNHFSIEKDGHDEKTH